MGILSLDVIIEGVIVLPNERKKPQQKDSLDVLKNTKMKGEEFSHEERMTNEVASTEYTGGGKKRGSLKDDKLETGGF